MWGTKTLGRARRRFGRVVAVDPDGARLEDARPPGAEGDGAGAGGDVEFRLSRRELDAFAARLDAAFATQGTAQARLDTPARLSSALARRIEAAGGRGRPAVERSPAGLYTPEYWRILVTGADRIARTEVERLVSAGGPRP